MLATSHDGKVIIDPRNMLKRIVSREPLSHSDAYSVASAILDGDCSDVETAALLTALQMRGETVDELSGFVRAVRDRSIRVSVVAENAIDTCGTGGSGLNTINVSTAAAIVAAAAGCIVAKHGNRSVSSQSGSSDVLASLGIEMDRDPRAAAERLGSHGITFLHAPFFHPGLRAVAGVRQQLGIRTVFNLVGPLANPAGVRRQVIGVYAKALLRDIVETLKHLGSQHVMVVHGDDGADEITLTGPTSVCELRDGEILEYAITPEQFGFSRCEPRDLRGGDATANAAAIERVFKNDQTPARDIILLNSAAALYVGGVASSIEDGVELARETVRSGRALAKLDELRSPPNEQHSDRKGCA